MTLNNLTVKHLKPRARPYKKADGEGLYIRVEPKGAKLWRLRYRFHGIEKTMTFGRYPTVTLKEARRRNREARALLASGIDPMRERKKAKAKAKAKAHRKLIDEPIIDAVLKVLKDETFQENLRVLTSIYLASLAYENEDKPLSWLLLEIQKHADTCKQVAVLIDAGEFKVADGDEVLKPESINPDTLLTPQECGERLGVTVHTLAIWRSAKSVPLDYVKVGRLVRYKASDVERFLDVRTKKGKVE